MTAWRRLRALLPFGTGRGKEAASADKVLNIQLQVHHPGEGWQNAGRSPSHPATLKRRMQEALARHGGDQVRAIDGDGAVVETREA